MKGQCICFGGWVDLRGQKTSAAVCEQWNKTVETKRFTFVYEL